MKFHVFIISALLMVCVVGSCSKSSDQHANEGTILRMYTLGTKDSVTDWYIYDRNANNSVISIRDSTNSYEYKRKLIYSSNGPLEKVEVSMNAAIWYTYEFEYNAAGRISKRISHSGTLPAEGYNVYLYDAAGHLTTDSQYTKVSNTTFALSTISRFQYTGDNVTEADNYSATSGSIELETKFKFDYDNRVNPVKDLEYEYYVNVSGSASYNITQRSKNNVLKSYIVFGDGNDWSPQLEMTNQYNAANYVWKSSRKNNMLIAPPIVTEFFYQ